MCHLNENEYSMSNPIYFINWYVIKHLNISQSTSVSSKTISLFLIIYYVFISTITLGVIPAIVFFFCTATVDSSLILNY